MIFALIFLYWPMYGLTLAFKNYNIVEGINGSPWAGMRYIKQFVNSYQFWPVLWNTIVLNVYALLALFPLPIILALLLNTLRTPRFSRAVQLITYAPYFISTVVVVGIIIMLFSPTTGVINLFIQDVTGQTINFLDATMFRHTYVWSGAWQTVGYSAIIYLAALAGVSRSCTRRRGSTGRASGDGSGTSTCQGSCPCRDSADPEHRQILSAGSRRCC